MQRPIRVLVVALLPLAGLACSSGGSSGSGEHSDGGASASSSSGSSSGGTASSSGGSSSGGASSSGGSSEGGGACTGVDDSPAPITATCDATATQTPGGGPIAAGSYVTSADVYLGGAPCSTAFAPGATLTIAGGVMSFTFLPAPGNGTEHQQWSYTVSGTSITETLLCDTDPNGTVGATQTFGYTASGGTLTLYFPPCCGDSYLGENVTFTKK